MKSRASGDPEQDGARSAERRRRLIEQRLAGRSSGTGAAGWPPIGADDGPAPLSSAQRRMWFVDHLNHSGVDYLVPLVLRFRGPLDAGTLQQALTAVQERHAVLRTRYPTSDGEPVQVTTPASEVHLPLVEADESELPDILAREGERGFDLAAGPVWRAKLLRLGAADHVLFCQLHHIACDGWSVELLCEDLSRVYTALRTGAPPPPPPQTSFGDHARRESTHLGTPRAKQDVDWWIERLSDATELELPTDRPRGALRDPAGARVAFTLPGGTVAGVARLAREHRSTPYVVLLAAFAALLAGQTGQRDVTVGTPVSGRGHPGTESVVGPFANSLVVRCDCPSELSFRQLIDRMRESVLASISRQDVPFEHLVEALRPERDLSRNPLVSTLFMLEEAGGRTPTRFDGLEHVDLPAPPAGVKVDLTLGLRQGNGGELLGALDYAISLFDEASVAALADRYVRILEAALDDPDEPLCRRDHLDDRERVWLERAATGDVTPTTELPLHELVRLQAERTPDACAVVADGESWTYRELDKRTDRLAQALQRAGAGRGDVVGVSLPRNADLVLAIVAVIKAGAAYLPLEPEDPPARLRDCVADAGAAAVVVAPDCARVFTNLVPTVAPRASADGDAAPEEEPLPSVGPRDLAYVIFTSGSTGRSKGVMVEHAGIVNRLEWMQDTYGLSPGDRVLQKTPFTFDVSVWEFFWPLITGATLVVAAVGAHRDLLRLDALIRAESVSHVHFVPTVLDAYLAAVDTMPPSLRHVLCSGEALHTVTAERFAAKSRASLHNLYGPAEASVDVTAHRVDALRTGASVPIGTPISNMTMRVLDAHLNQVGVGCPGELHLSGVGLARGYVNWPRTTAERFVPDPFTTEPGARMYRTGDLVRWRADGTLEFLRRIDTQVKLNGVRIELGEIESRIAGLPQVAAAAAVVYGGQLVAYVVARPGSPCSAGELRAQLSAQLPAAMVPARYVFLEELPLTRSGKVNRRTLPAPGGQRDSATDYVAPEGSVQQLMAAVWVAVLGLDQVGATDDFFALGGDSMRAVRLIGTLRERGLGVSLQDLFQHRSIAALTAASAVSAPVRGDGPDEDAAVAPFAQITERDRARLPSGVTDAYPVSQVQAGMLYELLADAHRRPYQNVTVYFIDDGAPLSSTALRRAVEQVTCRHEVLRTSFDLTTFSEPLQLVHGSTRVDLVVQDLEGAGEDEQRDLIRAAARQERSAPMDVGAAPLWRLRAYRTGRAAWCLAWVECHAILDGWSHNSLLSELMDRYHALRDGREPAPLDPPARRWAEFVAVERCAVASGSDHWAGVLDSHEALRLPAGMGGEPGPAHTVLRMIGAESARARELASAVGVPAKSVYLAAFTRTMSALAHADRFLCGLVCNGRPEVAGGDEVLGMFLNTPPFAVTRPTGSWRELIRAAAAAEVDLLPHRRFPLPRLQHLAGTTQPLVEAVFNYLDYYVLDGSGVEVHRTDDDSPNEFPLEVTVLPGAIDFTAAPERVRKEALDWLADTYCQVLDSMLSDVDGSATEPLPVPAGLKRWPESAARHTSPPTCGQYLPEPKRTPDGPGAPEPANLAADIAAVWREELGVSTVGLHDDFVEAGGGSLTAMRVAFRVSKRIDRKVSPTAVLRRRTIAALAESLGDDTAAWSGEPEDDRVPESRRPSTDGLLSLVRPAPGSDMIWFRNGGGTATLHCVHPGGGSAHWYQHLTEQLPAWLDVAAFQHPGLTEPEQAECSTEQLAHRYLDELRASRPDGPYHLFGWCGGAPIAWEMACRLRESGHQVNLMLLDPVLQVPGFVATTSDLGLLIECDAAYERLDRATAPEEIAALRVRVAELLPRIVIESLHDVLDDPELADVWRIAVRSWRRQIEARLPYRFRRTDGPFDLLACQELAGEQHESLAGLSFDAYLERWQALTAEEAHVHRVAGGNVTTMLPPHSVRVAALLAYLVAEVG